jgi:Lectin C-type domain
MDRARRPRCHWLLALNALTPALLLPACHTTLEPVRRGQSECQSLEILGAEYALCEAPLDHESAEQDCELRGARLAALGSVDEDEAVANEIFSIVTSGNVWLGGTRTDDFVWSWPDGTVFWRGGRTGEAEPGAFVSWQPQEPNNSSSTDGGPEACLALTAEGADWNDRACSLQLPYVCESD